MTDMLACVVVFFFLVAAAAVGWWARGAYDAQRTRPAVDEPPSADTWLPPVPPAVDDTPSIAEEMARAPFTPSQPAVPRVCVTFRFRDGHAETKRMLRWSLRPRMTWRNRAFQVDEIVDHHTVMYREAIDE